MTLKTAMYLLAVSACAQGAAGIDDKPSPVHYRSSTAPTRRSQNKSAPPPVNGVAPESSRNRVLASSDAPQAKMVGGVQSGIACFYGIKQPDAGVVNQEQDDHELRGAHAFLPFGSQVQVTNLGNGRSIKVTITDRIPSDDERIISVSRPAAERLGFVNAGTARVKLELLREASRM